MSPNEFQLREALREGEGDRPDPDAIIGRVLRLRYERRRRFSAIAAAAAVVAVLSGGTAALVGLNSGSDSAGSSAEGSRSTLYGAYQPAARGSSPSSAGSSVATGLGGSSVGCPSVFPQLALPGGGGIGSFGSDQPLFPRAVAAITVCAYGYPGAPVRRVLNGVDARELAIALESGTTTAPQSGSCGQGSRRPPVSVRSESFALYPVGEDGRTMPMVTFELATGQATNGTAVRYETLKTVEILTGPLIDGCAGNEGTPSR